MIGIYVFANRYRSLPPAAIGDLERMWVNPKTLVAFSPKVYPEEYVYNRKSS